VAFARRDKAAALDYGRAALTALDAAQREDFMLEVLVPAAESILDAAPVTEAAALREQVRLTLALVTSHFIDEAVRTSWFRTWVGRDLARLAGIAASAAGTPLAEGDHGGLGPDDLALLRLLTEGSTNREIASELGVPEDSVNRRLVNLYARIGVASRADATSAALLGRLV
jgi:DNA-binding NarL/FixJ family response regulator